MRATGRFTITAVLALALLTGLAAACAAPASMAESAFAQPFQIKTEKRLETEPVLLPSAWLPDTPKEQAPAIAEVSDDWLLLVNKTHPLAKEYAPGDMVRIKYCVGDHAESMRYMRSVPAEHFHAMVEAAAEEGYEIGIRTAYRSYDQQSAIFNGYVAKDGEEAANKYSARPGQSEHQSGLCADVTSPSVDYRMTTDYGQVPEGMWLAEHAHLYGFIIRYPLGKESITGYQYEPWHVRYVGIQAAGEIYEGELTLEEYLGVMD